MTIDEFASLASLVLGDAQKVVDLSRRVVLSDRQEHRRRIHGAACAALSAMLENQAKMVGGLLSHPAPRDRRADRALDAASYAARFAKIELRHATEFLFKKEIEG